MKIKLNNLTGDPWDDDRDEWENFPILPDH